MACTTPWLVTSPTEMDFDALQGLLAKLLLSGCSITGESEFLVNDTTACCNFCTEALKVGSLCNTIEAPKQCICDSGPVCMHRFQVHDYPVDQFMNHEFEILSTRVAAHCCQLK